MRTLIRRAAPGLSRRDFLAVSGAAGAGLTLGLPLTAAAVQPAAPAAGQTPFLAYVRISPDDTVTVLSAHLEMGQGIDAGIAALVAEELDADPAQMRAEGAAGNPALYANLATGGTAQETHGSTGIVSSFERYRRAGATARAMLVHAAAAEWGVPAAEITVTHGVIRHPSGRSAPFGALADAAARQPVPAEVPLKDPKGWKIIGSESLRRFDTVDKAAGRKSYTIDVTLPGLLTAVIAHPPRFGATVKSFDPAAAKAVAGVVEVAAISRGVAVIATGTWAAMKGREALTVEWSSEAAETRGTDRLMAEYRELAGQPPTAVAPGRGDAGAAMAGAARRVQATYEFPYLAHAALEPLDAVARMRDGRLEVWAPTSSPTTTGRSPRRPPECLRTRSRCTSCPPGEASAGGERRTQTW